MAYTKSGFVGYLSWTGAIVTALLGATLTLNVVIDPLWYFSGNRVFPENYAFNERLAKSNQLLKDPGAYDCLIFGSSRTTLLDESLIAGHNCFNYAFSGGRAGEFAVFARFARAFSVEPSMVIVGVDGKTPESNHDIPEFVLALERPPAAWQTYLSIDVLKFTTRTLQRKSPFPRYYTGELRGSVLPNHPRYLPPKNLGSGAASGPLSLQNGSLYLKIRAALPAATYVGYVPPISAWWIAEMDRSGDLDGYLDKLYATAQLFDRFYDFSVPSLITADPSRTYDGSHYMPDVNQTIAGILSGDPMSFGLSVHRLDRDTYRQQYKSAVRAFKRCLNRRTNPQPSEISDGSATCFEFRDRLYSDLPRTGPDRQPTPRKPTLNAELP